MDGHCSLCLSTQRCVAELTSELTSCLHALCACAVRLIVSGEDRQLQIDFLLPVLCKMDEYLWDEDVVEEDFEYDGCPYSLEPQYTDKELLEMKK